MSLVHALLEGVAVADDARGDHFAQQVVALTRTLAHAGEYRETVVFLGDVVDQLHDEHRLAHAGTAEQTDLAALDIGFEQVDDLDAGGQHLLRGGQFVELRGFAVDGQRVGPVEGFHAVDFGADDVEQTPLDLVTRRDRDRVAQGDGLHVAAQSVGGVHGNGAHGVLADMLLDLDDERTAVIAVDLHGVVDGREPEIGGIGLERHVHHRSDDL